MLMAIHGSNQQITFNIRRDNVTLKDLFIINGKSDKMVTFINITFIAKQSENGGAIYCQGANNTAKNGVVYTEDGNLNITDSLFSNTTNLTYGIIYATSEGNLPLETVNLNIPRPNMQLQYTLQEKHKSTVAYF